MASDADYAAFLEKANQDTSGGSSAAAVGGGGGGASSGEFASARAVDTDVPDELQGVMGYTYVSETDEPFEPVSLKWAHDELPSEDQFRELLDQKSGATVTILSLRDFDPQNAYGEVMSAVTTAAAVTTATTATATADESESRDGGSKGDSKDDGADASGQTRVYCVRHGKTRCEYYIVAVDRRKARLVGVRAKAVET